MSGVFGDGIGLAAGSANVIMQLSRLPVGRGVVESTVDTGRIDRHPLKRARTTLTYLAVAAAGTDAEKDELRRQVSHVHARVRSGPGSDVAYNAFDPQLQLWVAACIYRGAEDVYRKLHGPLGEEADDFYRRAAAYGTTLQMPERLWPENRAAFDRYWQRSVADIRLDDVTRGYLQGLATLRFLPLPFNRMLGPLNRFLTVGFLPGAFRQELRMPWSRAQQRRFDRWVAVAASVNRLAPRPLREFPFNVLLRDARRRIRRGQPII